MGRNSPYPYWFYVPASVVYGVLFLVPTVLALYFSLTRWSIFSSEFIGLDNYINVFTRPVLQVAGFFQVFWQTILWTVINVAFHVGLGLGDRPRRVAAVEMRPIFVPQIGRQLVDRNHDDKLRRVRLQVVHVLMRRTARQEDHDHRLVRLLPRGGFRPQHVGERQAA